MDTPDHRKNKNRLGIQKGPRPFCRRRQKSSRIVIFAFNVLTEAVEELGIVARDIDAEEVEEDGEDEKIEEVKFHDEDKRNGGVGHKDGTRRTEDENVLDEDRSELLHDVIIVNIIEYLA